MVKQNLNYSFRIIEMFSVDKKVTSCRKKKTDLTPFRLIATIF